jgi:hypothetical protein
MAELHRPSQRVSMQVYSMMVGAVNREILIVTNSAHCPRGTEGTDVMGVSGC